ncbi:hypothetical protein [Streptococcus ovuberis]|uniref:Uncharacterized protein n=1 Tax=Streptococcus ovuberis TaxID=1936207 RepID=A0A7X6N037_9STRE|nr:hypothetical protein [Streptococcus ovuberis]NKZ20879.1 hypothetical protein [Streptococcus ovuberis]
MKRKLSKLFDMLVTVGLALSLVLVSPYSVIALLIITCEECKWIVEKIEEVKWELPRQPIDLIILEDMSGSFKEAIGLIKRSFTTLTTPVAEKDYK